MQRLMAALLIATLGLAGCGRYSESKWNPVNWTNSGTPVTLEPEGGYNQVSDIRPNIPQILSAEWQPLNEGRLLVVRGFAPIEGYHDVALITAVAQPRDKLEPDPDGVLRLRMVAWPPAPETPAARIPANPVNGAITAALAIGHNTLAKINRVEITSASNVVSLAR